MPSRLVPLNDNCTAHPPRPRPHPGQPGRGHGRPHRPQKHLQAALRLLLADGLLVVRDLGSTNGTRVNGQRVRRGTLLPNDHLALAKFIYQFRVGDDLGPARILPPASRSTTPRPPPTRWTSTSCPRWAARRWGREQPAGPLLIILCNAKVIRLTSPGGDTCHRGAVMSLGELDRVLRSDGAGEATGEPGRLARRGGPAADAERRRRPRPRRRGRPAGVRRLDGAVRRGWGAGPGGCCGRSAPASPPTLFRPGSWGGNAYVAVCDSVWRSIGAGVSSSRGEAGGGGCGGGIRFPT